ncbi:MAG: hypothetical protein JWO06_1788 [Bacteroidota bacterium]|nr:hypothetical protein [Bacteroidota bacterium]
MFFALHSSLKLILMKGFLKPGVLFISIIAMLASCKKGADTSLLTLRLHSNIDTAAIVTGTTYTNKMGRNISFSRTEYYLSNIQLTNTDGSLVPVSGIVLVNSSTTDYTIGSVPIGNYKSISFDVGLNTNNHDDPTAHTGNDPLAVQSPSMHFSTNTLGYIFMAVEGLVDSTGAGTPNKPFSYLVGTDALLRPVTMGDHSVTPYTAFAATSQKVMVVDLIADFGTFSKNVDMNANPVTNSSDYPVVADSLAKNIPLMFRYGQ